MVAAPYVLPAIGIGSSFITEQIASLCQASGQYGLGLAGTLNEAFSAVPVIGESLAAGGWASAVSSGLLGTGGTFLGNYVTHNFDRPGHLPWGKIIKYAAIGTSILIALPSLLSALSMGATYLAFAFGGIVVASNVAGSVGGTLGLMGGTNVAAAGASLSGLIAHLITCGSAILPLGLSAYLNGHQHHSESAVELISASPIMAGQPCQLAFRLRDESGRLMRAEDIQVTHTEKLHTMIVDNTLNEYHHLHPTFDATSGLFTCEFTPRSAQGFTAWHEFTLVGQSAPVQARVELAPARGFALKPFIVPTSQSQSGGITASITATPPLAAGRASMLRVTLRDANGEPVKALEPMMGAYGHLAGFSSDGQHFIHSHPAIPLGAPLENGTLEFHVTPEQAGLTKFFLQVKRDGQEIILPFSQAIAQGKTFTARASAPATGHAHHAMA